MCVCVCACLVFGGVTACVFGDLARQGAKGQGGQTLSRAVRAQGELTPLHAPRANTHPNTHPSAHPSAHPSEA